MKLECTWQRGRADLLNEARILLKRQREDPLVHGGQTASDEGQMFVVRGFDDPRIALLDPRAPIAVTRDSALRHRSLDDLPDLLFISTETLVLSATKNGPTSVNEAGDYSFKHLNRGLTEPLVIRDGAVVVPERPGIGLGIDWDLLQASGLIEIE